MFNLGRIFLDEFWNERMFKELVDGLSVGIGYIVWEN